MKTQIKGTIYILVSAVFFGTYGVWSKMMSGVFDEFTQGWTRSLIILLLLLPVGIATKSFRSMHLKDAHWWIIYAVPGSLVIPLYYYGFSHLSIGAATLVFYASLTIASYLLGFVFFREKITTPKLFSLLLGLGGLYTIYAKSVSLDGALGWPILVTAAAGICGGIEVVFTKKLSHRYSPIQLTFFLFLVSFLLCLGLSVFIGGTLAVPSWSLAWVGNIGHALASIAAFFLIVIGYKHIEPSVGGIVGLTEILFGIGFGIVLFNEVITPSVVFGALCIIVAAAIPNIADLVQSKRHAL